MTGRWLLVGCLAAAVACGGGATADDSAAGAPAAEIAAGISADTCIRYALSQPVSSIVVGIMAMDELLQNVASARSFEPLPETDQATLLASVKDVAGDGRFELYKTTQRMDGPYHVKQHGFQVA